MDFLLQFVIFVVAVFTLIKGSDIFVEKAEKIGLALGIPSFIIGVTVVAFGTSLPELGSSIAGVLSGNSEIVVGNVVGSNVSNLLFIVGVLAIVARQVDLKADILKTDVPILLISAVLMYFMVADGTFTLTEAVLSVVGLGVFLSGAIQQRGENKGERQAVNWKDVVWLVAAGIFIFLGAEFTVRSMSSMAGTLGIPESFIAITMLAFGTSLPEVLVSIVAAKHGKVAMAMGNIIGSNIFNTFGVLGISSFFGRLIIPSEVLDFGLPFMMAATFLFAFLCIGRRISLWIGILLLIAYAFFILELSKAVFS